MPDGSPEARSWLRPTLIALAVTGLVAHALVFDFVNDDAFISFRYADNLVRHGELVFNPGERVEGYTNFLWTLLMAGVLGLGLDVVAWSKALGVVFAAGTLLVVARFTARHTGARSGWDALAPVLLAAWPAYACWSTGGLETQQFTFFATLGWTRFLGERQTADEGRAGRWPWSGVFFALAALARPEGLLFFGLTGLARLVEMVAVDRTIKPTRQDWLWGAGFAAVFAPYQAWRWWYYGWPFPNTYYVKAGSRSFWAPGWRYFASWVVAHGLWATPPLMALRRGLPGRREGRLIGLGALYIAVVSVYVMKVGGDFMALHRFLVPLMPIVAVLTALGLRVLVERLVAAGHRPGWIAAGAALAAALYGVQVARVDREALVVGSEGGVDSIGWLAMFAAQTTAIGQYLAANAPPDASLATTAAGIIPFYSRLHTLDVLGLNDEWIAHNVEAHGSRPGHTKSAPLEYVLERDIDYLVYHPTIAARRPEKGAGEKRSWQARGYRWEAVEVPGLDPPWWGYWRRVDGAP
ncbi:MAG: hypothetical protein H6701_14015 [Myxococcales bacterium]|nr:hypothetical protein [Myxococcales bacterium]